MKWVRFSIQRQLNPNYNSSSTIPIKFYSDYASQELSQRGETAPDLSYAKLYNTANFHHTQIASQIFHEVMGHLAGVGQNDTGAATDTWENFYNDNADTEAYGYFYQLRAKYLLNDNGSADVESPTSEQIRKIGGGKKENTPIPQLYPNLKHNVQFRIALQGGIPVDPANINHIREFLRTQTGMVNRRKQNWYKDHRKDHNLYGTPDARPFVNVGGSLPPTSLNSAVNVPEYLQFVLQGGSVPTLNTSIIVRYRTETHTTDSQHRFKRSCRLIFRPTKGVFEEPCAKNGRREATKTG